MALDILGYRDKWKDFYGDMPLEEVAQDAFKRGGYEKQFSDYESWKKSAGIDSAIQEDTMKRSGPQDSAPTRLVKAFLQGAAEGVTTELPSMVGGALGFAASHTPFKGIQETGKSLKEWAEEKRQELYGPEIERTGLERIVYEGTKMLAPSILPGGVVGTVARGLKGVNALTKAGRIAEATAAAKSATNIAGGSVAGLFGMSQAQQTKDTAEKAGVDPGFSPYLTGAIEAAGEFLGTKYLAKLFRLDEAAVMKRGVGEFVKDLLKTIGVEVGTEMGQSGGEAAVEKYSGIRPTASPIGEAIDVIGPTTFMTLLTAGLAGGANKLRETKEDPEGADYLEKLKIGAIASMSIKEGLQTGKLDGDPFTPENALEIIREGQKAGIYDDDSIERFKERYPQLRDGLNGVIAERFAEKVEQEVLGPKKIIPVTNTETDVPDFQEPEEGSLSGAPVVPQKPKGPEGPAGAAVTLEGGDQNGPLQTETAISGNNLESKKTGKVYFKDDISPYAVSVLWEDARSEADGIAERNKAIIESLKTEKSSIPKGDRSGRKKAIDDEIKKLNEEISVAYAAAEESFNSAADDYAKRILKRAKDEGIAVEENDVYETISELSNGRVHDVNGGKTWTEPLADQVLRELRAIAKERTGAASPAAEVTEKIPEGYLARGTREGGLVLGQGGGVWATDSIENAKSFGDKIEYVKKPEKILEGQDPVSLANSFRQEGDKLESVDELTEDDWTKIKDYARSKGYDAINFGPMHMDNANDIWIIGDEEPTGVPVKPKPKAPEGPTGAAVALEPLAADLAAQGSTEGKESAAGAAPTPAAAGEAKEPWQMTKKEYANSGNELSEVYHFNGIVQALREGKPVPEEVLKDYPELQSTTVKPRQKLTTRFYTENGNVGSFDITDKAAGQKVATKNLKIYDTFEEADQARKEWVKEEQSRKTVAPAEPEPKPAAKSEDEPAEIFIRPAERSDLGRVQKSLNAIPEKRGYEKVYKKDGKQGRGFYYVRLRVKTIKVDNRPKNHTEAKNLAQFIIAIGKVRLGSFTSRTGTAWDRAHGKRGKDQSREMGVIKAVASVNGKYSMDEAASMANADGYRDRDGQPFTDVTLFRELAEGDARKVLRPDLQESKIEKEIERQENEWIAEQLAKLEAEGVDAGRRIEEDSESIISDLDSELEAEGYSPEQLEENRKEIADFFEAAAAQAAKLDAEEATVKLSPEEVKAKQSEIAGTSEAENFSLDNPTTDMSKHKNLSEQVTPKNEDLFAEPKEDAFTAAVGVIGGGAADRIKESKYEFAYGETKAKSDAYYDMVGMFSGGKADRLIDAGITIRLKETAAPEAKKVGDALTGDEFDAIAAQAMAEVEGEKQPEKAKVPFSKGDKVIVNYDGKKLHATVFTSNTEHTAVYPDETDDAWGADKNIPMTLDNSLIELAKKTKTQEESKAPETQAEAKPFKVGDRVVMKNGRHGEIVADESYTMRSYTFGSGSSSVDRTIRYRIKSDAGSEYSMYDPAGLTMETERPGNVVPDILSPVSKEYETPDDFIYHTSLYRRDEKKQRAAAQRARKQENINDYLRQAEQAKNLGDKMQAAFDEWAAKYPEEAKKYKPEPAPATQAAVSGQDLSAFNLRVTKTQTKTGKAVWEVSGSTKEHMAVLKAAGGRWYNPKKVWSYYNADPTNDLLSRLGVAPKPVEAAQQQENKPSLTHAATEAGKGVEATYDALAALFKAKAAEKRGSMSGLDSDLYAAVKPLFAEAYQHFRAAGREVKDWIVEVISQLKARGISPADSLPYVKHFYMNDMQALTKDAEVDKIKVTGGNENAQDNIHTEPVRQPDVAGTPGLDDGQSPGSNADNVPGKESEGVSGSQNGVGDGKTSAAPGGGNKGRPGRGDRPGSDNLTEQRPGTDERGSDGTDTATEEADSGMGGTGLPAKPGTNNRIGSDDVLFHSGKVARINANIKAIATLKKIEAEGRPATAEEQKILQQFSGWGAVTEDVFKEKFVSYLEQHEKHPTDYRYSAPSHYFYSPSELEKYQEWESKYGKKLHPLLGGMLTKEEWQMAADSGLNAHYTSPEIIKAMWQMAERLGVDKGNVLEPAAGVGHFLGLMPENLVGKVKLAGVELDPITGRILKALYPQSKIQVSGFEKAGIQDNFYDMVISNFPFGDYPVHDAAHPAYNNWHIHNYFFARALDAARPGGIVMAVTSRYTMDSTKNGKVREYLAGKADFIGAIRLPGTTFSKNAGTEVTTDIIILQKKTGTAFPNAINWRTVLPIKSKEGDTFNINEYFVSHPEMVLGEHSSTGTMYGGKKEYTLLPKKTATMQEQLEQVIETLPRDITKGQEASEVVVEKDVAGQHEKDGTLIIQNGKLGRVKGAFVEPVSFADNAAKVKRAKEYVAIRDLYKELIDAMNNETTSDDEIAGIQAKMNSLYDKFVSKNGHFHDRGNKYLNEDDEYVLALSLEDVKNRPGKKGGIDIVETYYEKGDAFTKRTVYPFREPKSAENIEDAANLSLTYRNAIDLSFIAGLLRVDVDAAKAQLLGKALAYENPSTGLLEHPAEYLSGNVRRKLHEAEAAGEQYKNNVEALKNVQPPNKVIDEIPTRLGDEWIPADIIKDFARSIVPDNDLDVAISSVQAGGESAMVHWTVRARGYINENSPAYVTWGAEHHNLYELMEDCLNLKRSSVYDWVPDEHGDGGKEVFNLEKSLVARQKQKEIQEAFRSYIMGNNEVGVTLANIFNTEKNNYVIRQYETPKIDHYPGASNLINLRDHQKRGVARGMTDSTIFAHAVGTGKTYLYTTLGMELRRIKAARKPTIVVQGSTIKQFATSARKLYPTAKILALTKDITNGPENRRSALAKIASGDWDLVIVPHSTFNLIGSNPTREAGFIQEQLDEIRDAIREEGGSDPDSSKVKRNDSMTVKQLRKMLKRKEARLKSLRDKPHEDNAIYFEDLGIDALLIDEAHAYKRGDFFTKMDNIKGLDRSASQKSFDFLMKVRYVQEKTGGKNIYLATGTPITNTLAEIWTIMRYTRPELLREYGVEHFDGFASLFTEAVADIEPTETGEYQQVERLKKYRNGFEMMNMWLTAADVILQEDVPGWKDMVPALKGGGHTNITLERSEELGKLIDSIRQRRREWNNLTGKEKRAQSHVPLVLYGEAKKAAIDLRLVHPQNPDTKESKVNTCVKEAYARYKESDAIKGTQLIFCDIYQSPDPAAMRVKKNELGVVVSRELANPHLVGIPRFNLYADIKKKLIEKGIPENEIAIINDKKYDKDEAKERLFEMVNDGAVRIVLGSTEKLGTGVNAQERMVAIHNIDAPTRPMDLEQRIGRVIRPGNINKEAEVVNYTTVNSLDSVSFTRLREKMRFVNQVLRGTLPGSNFDDPTSELQATFEDLVAFATNNPLVMKRFELENQIRELSALSEGWGRKQGQLRESIVKTQKQNKIHRIEIPVEDKKANFLKEKFPPGELRTITSENGDALPGTILQDTFAALHKEKSVEYDKIVAEAKTAQKETVSVKTGKGDEAAFDSRKYSEKIRELREVKTFRINGVKLELAFEIDTHYARVEDWGEGHFTVSATLGRGIYDYVDWTGTVKKVQGNLASTSGYKTIKGMLDNLESKISQEIMEPDRTREKIANNDKSIASMQAELEKPFRFGDKLKALREELKYVYSQIETPTATADDNFPINPDDDAETIRLKNDIKTLYDHLKQEEKGTDEYRRLEARGEELKAQLRDLTADHSNEQASFEESPQYRVVHHGTPHIWRPEPGFPHGRMRLDKSGTGEGNASFGHGAYLAGAEETGKAYLSAGGSVARYIGIMRELAATQGRSNTVSVAGDTESLYGAASRIADNDFEFINALPDKIKDRIAKTEGGSLYKLDIPDDVIPKLLDWDKPLGEQSGKVFAALSWEHLASTSSLGQKEAWDLVTTVKTGGDLYRRLATALGSDKAASEYLASIGIPGNKYLDQMSRDKGDGTHNYVIWDQKVLDRIALLERNGEKLDAIREAQARETESPDTLNKTSLKALLDEFAGKLKGIAVEEKDGALQIRTRGGNVVQVYQAEMISVDEIVLQVGYGRSDTTGGRITGKFTRQGEKREITLRRDAAGLWTLSHEFVHFLESIGAITSEEQSILDKKIAWLIKRDPENYGFLAKRSAAERRAEYLGRAVVGAYDATTFTGKIIQKIKDIIDAVLNAFGVRTARGIERDIVAGKVYGRQAALTPEAASGSAYSVTKDKGTANIPPETTPKAVGGIDDKAYLDLINDGKFRTAQRIVNKAFGVEMPKTPISDKIISDIAQTIDLARPRNESTRKYLRQYAKELKQKGLEFIDAYHVSDIGIDEFKKHGIKGTQLDYIGGTSGNLREASTYLFLDPSDIPAGYNGINGAKNSISNIIHIKIPVKNIEDMLWDSNFNLSFDTYSSVRMIGDIPSRWIKGEYKYTAPFVLDANKNVIPLSKRVADLPNPSRPPEVGGQTNFQRQEKEDIRYSFEEDLPTSKDPKVLNLYLKDETDAFVQTMMNKLQPKHMTWLETMLKSPEWFDHPQIQAITKIFMRDRNEIYHETFNNLNLADDMDTEQETISEAAKALKNKGLTLAERLAGKVSPEYQRLQEILDEGDTSWQRNKSLPLEDQIAKFEQHIRRQGATEDTIRVWKLYRQSYDKALDLMTAQLRQMIEEITEEAHFRGEKPDLSELSQTLRGALAEMKQWKGFYAPRLREMGNWKVQAYKEHGPMKENREWYREHRGSELSARRLAQRLQREGWKIHSVGEVEKLPEAVYQDVKSVNTAKLIDSALEKMSKKSSLGDKATKLNEEVLRAVSDEIKARGFRSTMIHRGRGNVVRGFIEDPIQRHLQYINNVSGGIAKARSAKMAMKELHGEIVMGKRVGGIDPTKDPEAYRVATNYIEEQLRNAEPIDRMIGLAKSIATFKFLGFNLRSLAVNTTAIITTAPAAIHQYALGGKGSMLGIIKALGVAGKDYAAYMAGKAPADKWEQAFLNDITQRGWDDAQYTREALGEIAKTHSRVWSTAMDASMYLFGKSEQWNRGTTMLAAYRLARKQGMSHAQASEEAKEASDKAHGIYGKATMPMWAMGTNPAAKIGQMFYVYQKFGHNYLQMLYDMGAKKHNIKGLMFATLSPLVLAGAAAAPLKEVFLAMFAPLFRLLFDDDRDPEKWVWDEIRKHLGAEAEKIGRHGLTGAMGVDISSSLSAGVGIPKNFIDLTGAIGGVATEIVEAKESIRNKQYGRAAEHLLPTGFANPLRAMREAQEGVTTKNNRRIWDEQGRLYKPSPGATLARAFGFRSADQAVLSERTWEGHRQQAHFAEMRDKIYERYRAWMLGKRDREEYREIVKEIQEYNRMAKGKPGVSQITMQSLQNQARRMAAPSKADREILRQ